MPYNPQQWRNGDPTTPLSAARLLHMEQGISDSLENSPEGREELIQSEEMTDALAAASGVVLVVTGDEARPDVSHPIIWVGGDVRPVNSLPTDLWARPRTV